MTDLEHILPLWNELEAAGADYVLATVVAVEGSSYRRPGARMLLAQDGRRAGTVRGGCLEGAVAQKGWWRTAGGPLFQRYSTLDDDGDLPYGSGCGGVVYILLERRQTAAPLLQALHAAFNARVPLAIATVLEGPRIGRRAFASALTRDSVAPLLDEDRAQGDLALLAAQALENRSPQESRVDIGSVPTRVWVDYRTARPGLWIFGAGDDAKPLLNLARELGWFVAIADGRSHLATRARFAKADEVHAFDIGDLPHATPSALDLHPTDAAVLITHSFEQDSRILAWLLGGGRSLAYSRSLAYIGVLGPQRRTREALTEVGRILQHPPTAKLVDQWLDDLHAPTGLDLGADTPASIALSILAEIQKTLNAASALPLRQMRATKVPVTQD
jgi:xanthine/CO dehydrogenase XdhC/CoxF family maturation factor